MIRASSHHGALMVGSLLFALLLAADLHYTASFGVVGDWTRDIACSGPGPVIPSPTRSSSWRAFWSPCTSTRCGRFVERWYRQVIAGAVLMGVDRHPVVPDRGLDRLADRAVPPTSTSRSPSSGSPRRWRRSSAAPGCGGGAARRRPRPRPSVFSAEYLAGLTGGIFLCHVIFINLVRSGLGDAGITPHLGWAGMVAVTFVLTMGSAALFTALILRTPLRWVLGGPVRAEQRARLGPEVLAARASPSTGATSRARGATRALRARLTLRADAALARVTDHGAGTQRASEELSSTQENPHRLSLHFLIDFFPFPVQAQTTWALWREVSTRNNEADAVVRPPRGEHLERVRARARAGGRARADRQGRRGGRRASPSVSVTSRIAHDPHERPGAGPRDGDDRRARAGRAAADRRRRCASGTSAWPRATRWASSSRRCRGSSAIGSSMPRPGRREGSPCASCTSGSATSSPSWRRVHPDGDVLVVTHGGVIRVAQAYCGGIAVDDMTWGPVPNASVWGLGRARPPVAVAQ